MAFVDKPWDGSASRYSDAGAYCRACLVDNNASGAAKVEDQCHFPYKEPNGDVNVNALRSILSGRGAQAQFPGAQAARAEARRLLDQYNSQQGGRSEDMQEPEELSGGESVYRAVTPELLRYVDPAEDSGAEPVIEGRMMPYDEWTEVRSPLEGHFIEQFAAGSLAKSMSEQKDRIKVMFEHGLDHFGRQPIAVPTDFEDKPDGAYFRAELLKGLPDLLIDGLRKGVYGTSIRFEPIKWQRNRFPRRSEQNPDGIPEHTVREARIKEFSITPFPIYAGTTAHVRSLTDEMAVRRLLGDPEQLAEFLATRNEPQHSEPETTEEVVTTPSRSTHSPSRDYLDPKEGGPSWQL